MAMKRSSWMSDEGWKSVQQPNLGARDSWMSDEGYKSALKAKLGATHISDEEFAGMLDRARAAEQNARPASTSTGSSTGTYFIAGAALAWLLLR